MTILVDKQRLLLDSTRRRVVIPSIALPSLTSKIKLSIDRPTTLQRIAWGVADTLRVGIYVEVDGLEEYCALGRATGGVVLSRFAKEHAVYQLGLMPTWGFFDQKEGFPVRLGERSKSYYQARIEIESLSGACDSAISVEIEEAQAPRIAYHSSVAFDAATDALETGGDGVISLSHTATGSNRCALACTGNTAGTVRSLSSITYGGVSMTEIWDTIYSTFHQNGGAILAAPATGSQTVTATMSGAITDYLILGVMTFTGVDQTTPNGTPVGNTSGGTSNSVTVTGVGSDDMVASNHTSGWNGTVTGADETERYKEIPGAEWTMAGFTQLGSAGGVMSCSRSAAGSSDNNRLVAVRLIASTGGGPSAIAGTASLAFSNSGTLLADGTLAGSSALAFSPAATLSADGALAGSSSVAFSNAGTLAADGTLAGASALAFSNAGTLAADGALAGSSAVAFSLTGTLNSPPGAIAGTSTITFSPTGTLTGKGALSGASYVAFSASANIPTVVESVSTTGGGGRYYAYPIERKKKPPQVVKIEEEIRETRKKRKEIVAELPNFDAERMLGVLAALDEQISRLMEARKKALEFAALNEEESRAKEQRRKLMRRRVLVALLVD